MCCFMTLRAATSLARCPWRSDLSAFLDVLLLALLFATPAPKMFLAGVAVTLAAAKT